MPYQIVRNNITDMHVDAIVNPTDPVCSGSGGVDAFVHGRAGEGLRKACDAIRPIEAGKAAVTDGFDLPCRYIIHTVGPVWRGGAYGEQETLCACYRNTLEAAAKRHCETIAISLISSGTFGYPKDRVMRVALETIGAFLMTHDMAVYLVVYDKDSYAVSKKLQADVEAFIDEHYIETAVQPQSTPLMSDEFPLWDKADFATTTLLWDEQDANAQPDDAEPIPAPEPKPNDRSDTIEFFAPSEAQIEAYRPAARPQRPTEINSAKATAPKSSTGAKGKTAKAASKTDLEAMLSKLDEGFSGTLLRMIDERGMTDAACYKRANIDKRLFSKIRSNPQYQPSKPTVLAFAVALELSLDESRKLLEKAGLALSNSSKFDIIVTYFLETENYNLMEINEVLYKHDQPCLGNVIG